MDRGRPVFADVPAQNLRTALRELSWQTGLNVVVETRDAAQVRSSAVHGMLERRAVIAALIFGTGIDYSFLDHNTIGVFPKRSKSGSATKEGTSMDAVPTSRRNPNAVFGPDELQLAGNIPKRGFSPSQDALGDPPQFPGRAEGMEDSGQATRRNATRGCALDTRGLGPPAALVLRDGERWPPRWYLPTAA
jgi:hypothetical protein